MQDRVFLTHCGIIPPFPLDLPTKTKSKSADETRLDETSLNSHPSRLLGLIRSIEKKERGTESYENGMEEIVDLFNHLIAVYSRRGLLGGDSDTADRILSSAENSYSNSASLQRGGAESRRRNGKRGKKGTNSNSSNTNSDDLRIQHHPGTANSDTSGAQQPDEALIFTAILRILAQSASASGEALGSNKALTRNTNLSSNGTSNASASANANAIDDDRALLIGLSCELCLAIAQHIKIYNESSETCTLAEYELLAQSGKPMLSGLSKTIKLILEQNTRNTTNSGKTTTAKNDDGENDDRDPPCLTTVIEPKDRPNEPCAVSSTLASLFSLTKLAASLVTLFGTKLSRSTALLSDLTAISWKLLTIDDDTVQDSAARLLSCLPVAGGIDRTTPSDIWNARVSETLTGLSVVLDAMAPLTTGGGSGGGGSKRNGSGNNNNSSVEQWIRFVRIHVSDESSRLRCFYRFSRGLTRLFRFLVLQDGMDHKFCSSSTLVDARIDMKQVLGVVESFVSFPLSAETVYYRTKRRLRNEIMDHGLLSPRIIATEAANHAKLMGHELLDCILDAVGGPALLPFARRILRISYASVLTSSSSAVRRVMDPTSAAQLEGKKRRWLHLSIRSRALAIETVGRAMTAFGCDNDYGPSSSSSSSSILSTHNQQQQQQQQQHPHTLTVTTDGEKAITLVVGSLVEQLYGCNTVQTGEYDDDWGTIAERVELVSASATCLAMVLVSCGGFLSVSIRTLIESVVFGALSQIMGEPTGTRRLSSFSGSSKGSNNSAIQILSWSPVKTSIVRLACGCVSTPWKDGSSSSSSLVDLLAATAQTLKRDVDPEVSTTAAAALRICDTLAVPRAPALTYAIRAVVVAPAASSNPSATTTTTDAALLATNIESARNETIRARKKVEEVELAKKRKAEEKKRKKEEEQREKNKTMAAKRQKATNKKLTIANNDDNDNDNSRKARDPVGETKSKSKTESQSKSKSESPRNNSMATDSTAVTPKAENDQNSTKSDTVVREAINTNKEKKDDKDEDDAMGVNDNSDNDELPEIFDGEPDSDDE